MSATLMVALILSYLAKIKNEEQKNINQNYLEKITKFYVFKRYELVTKETLTMIALHCFKSSQF